MKIEDVVFVLNYHDGPVEGLSSSTSGMSYFRAVFDEESDYYSSTFEIVRLDAVQTAEGHRLFDNARIVDPACNDSGRRAFATELQLKLQRAVEAGRFAKATGTFRALSPGVYGEYVVGWTNCEGFFDEAES